MGPGPVSWTPRPGPGKAKETNAGAEDIGHGALMVREQTTVRAEHSIRSAKPFIGIAEFRRPSP